MTRPKSRRPTHQQRGSGSEAPSSRRVAWIVVGVVVAAVVVFVGLSAGEPAATATERDPVLVAEGADLYQANCAECHGVDLMGTETGPPFLNLIYAPNHHGDESFQRAVVGGVVAHHWGFGNMEPVDGLSRDDVAAIIEFVRSEQEEAGVLRDPTHP